MHFFDEHLAEKIGINESIFLQNLYYLSKKNLIQEHKTFNEEDIWVTMSTSTIQNFQPYFTRSIIRTIIKKLEERDLIVKHQFEKRMTNTFSYTLTDRAWILMLTIDKKSDIKKLTASCAENSHAQWRNALSNWLNHSEQLAKIANLWLILAVDMQNLANIYIDNRNLIESNRNIEFSDLEKNEKKDSSYTGEFNEEIHEILVSNNDFKRRVEKTFLGIDKFRDEIIIPSIERNGYLKSIEALKKAVERHLPHISPVANFRTYLMELKSC
ncbi:MAG: hypothetical protein ACRDAQ_09190 [Cetobacterium sp.]